ncbi:MAG: hypothetical protein QOH06_3759 [Acidobacteriota bacterium]|jgi:hypothetical protein|nr:hypothetical protein [Acidobacteriota bacterium]
MILFAWEIPEGEKPKPWYTMDGQPRSPIVIRLDERPAPEIPANYLASEQLAELVPFPEHRDPEDFDWGED